MKYTRGFFRLVPPLCTSSRLWRVQSAHHLKKPSVHYIYITHNTIKCVICFYKIAIHENQNKRKSRSNVRVSESYVGSRKWKDKTLLYAFAALDIDLLACNITFDSAFWHDRACTKNRCMSCDAFWPITMLKIQELFYNKYWTGCLAVPQWYRLL